MVFPRAIRKDNLASFFAIAKGQLGIIFCHRAGEVEEILSGSTWRRAHVNHCAHADGRAKGGDRGRFLRAWCAWW
jgi:hypothetical protein